MGNKSVGPPSNANQFGISSRPLPLRAFNAPSDRPTRRRLLSVCLSDYYGRYVASQLSNESYHNELNLLYGNMFYLHSPKSNKCLW